MNSNLFDTTETFSVDFAGNGTTFIPETSQKSSIDSRLVRTDLNFIPLFETDRATMMKAVDASMRNNGILQTMVK